MAYLVQKGVIQSLGSNLALEEKGIVKTTLECLAYIFDVGSDYFMNENHNSLTSLFDQGEMLNNLKRLQNHNSPYVFTLAEELIETYFKD
jgi:hypothetical protein